MIGSAANMRYVMRKTTGKVNNMHTDMHNHINHTASAMDETYATKEYVDERIGGMSVDGSMNMPMRYTNMVMRNTLHKKH